MTDPFPERGDNFKTLQMPVKEAHEVTITAYRHAIKACNDRGDRAKARELADALEAIKRRGPWA